MTYAPLNSKTAYLNTTEYFPEDKSQLLVKLTSIYSNVAKATNVREISLYDLIEQMNGQQFFDPTSQQKKRFGFRKCFQIGPIAAGATQTIPHGISGTVAPFTTVFTSMYGTCRTNVVDYRPIPYADVTAVTNQISLRVNGANLLVSNGATAPAIVSGIVVLEYLLA